MNQPPLTSAKFSSSQYEPPTSNSKNLEASRNSHISKTESKKKEIIASVDVDSNNIVSNQYVKTRQVSTPPPINIEDNHPFFKIERAAFTKPLNRRNNLQDWLREPDHFVQLPNPIASVSDAQIEQKNCAFLNGQPIHFIWFGSPIPDDHFKNAIAWAQKYPERLTLIWTNSELLTKNEEKLMSEINDPQKLCKILKENNLSDSPCRLKVIDINESSLLKGSAAKEIDKWLFKEIESAGKYKAAAFTLSSDIYRAFLMYYGSDCISSIESLSEFRELKSSGMIYLDTDTDFSVRQGLKSIYYDGILFSMHGNDAFAVSHNYSSFSEHYLCKIITRVHKAMKKGSLLEFLNEHGMLAISAYESLRDAIPINNRVFIPFTEKSEERLYSMSWFNNKALEMKRTIFNA